MTPLPLLKTLFQKIGRTPISAFPGVSFHIATETAETTPPLIVAAATLSEKPSTPNNKTIEAEIDFSLSFNAADFSDTEAEQLIESTANLLSGISAYNLNISAEEIEAPILFYSFKWATTHAPEPDTDGTLSVRFTYRASAQM